MKQLNEQILKIIHGQFCVEGYKDDFSYIEKLYYYHINKTPSEMINEEVNTKFIFVINLFSTWEILINYDLDLTQENVLKLHQVIGRDIIINNGLFRTYPVKISDTWHVPPTKITKRLIKKFNQKLMRNNIIDCALYTMKTQMFNDGNKRMAFMILSMYYLKQNKLVNLNIDNFRTYVDFIMIYYNYNDPSPYFDFVNDNLIQYQNT